MDIKPISNRMYSLLVLYDMQTKFFASVIEGISDKDANNRMDTKANHVAWLTGSLVQDRYDLVNSLGTAQQQQTAHELFEDHKGIQDGVTYPPLATFKKDWEHITPLLRELLLKVTDDKLDQPFEMMPGTKFPYFDLITFITYRESNCIGQIALWRRLLGYPGMKYM